ncbi:MAG: hypothetical protein K2N35_16275 [Muribaculaceae bacterium]|nr:hypothetical protein [Muribaculaceae bacterium]
MAQENIDDWFSIAKHYAQAEKELGIQHWVHISIKYTDNVGNIHLLYAYDLPREVYERRSWVPEWRQARYKCQFPRENISCYYFYYDKRLGNDSILTSDLRKLTAAKAQVTRIQNMIDEYVNHERESNMFFDEASDQDLKEARRKLDIKKSNVEAAEMRMKEKINQIKGRKI